VSPGATKSTPPIPRDGGNAAFVSYPRVEESGRWKLIQDLKQVPAHWESELFPVNMVGMN